MPTTSLNTSTYKFSRTWQRNGYGPKVPHPFLFKCSKMLVDTSEGRLTLSSGGAGTHIGAVPPSQKLRLYRKLRDEAYASAQLGADLGEMKQTLQMVGSMLHAVRSPLQTMGRYMRKAARRQGKATGLVKDVADAYLTFTYGVKPLMQSIFDVSNVLSHPSPRQRVKVSTRSSYDDPVYTANGFPSGPFAYVERIHHITSMQGGCDIMVENPMVFTAEQLGLLNPVSVVWELVPFSFVIDWFLPIGTYVAAISDFAGCTITNAYTTEFVRTKGYRSYINKGWTAVDEAVMCCRALGMPELPKITSVGLKLSQSKQHVTNALALIASIKL